MPVKTSGRTPELAPATSRATAPKPAPAKRTEPPPPKPEPSGRWKVAPREPAAPRSTQPAQSTVPSRPASGAATTGAPKPQEPAASPAAQRAISDAMKQMNLAQQELRTKGTIGSKVASALTGGALGGAAQSVDSLVATVNGQYQAYMVKGYLTERESRLMDQSVRGAMSSIGDVKEIRRDVLNTTVTAATGAGLAVATVATAGMAAPAAVATLGAVGAGTRAGTMAVMEGSNYSLGRAAQDAAIGAVQGGTSAIGGSVGTGVAKAASSASARVIGQTGARVLGGAIQGASSGAVGGAVSQGAEAAVTVETWKQGASQGLRTVGQRAGQGAVSGAVGGGIVGGLVNIRGQGIYDSVTKAKIEADLSKAYEQAAKAHPKLQAAVDDVAKRTNGTADVPTALKGRDRALEKVLNDYGGDASRITDLSRGSITFDSADDARRALDQLKERFEVVRVKDRFAKPGPDGYRDMLVNLKIDGHVVEVQLHHKGILAVKNGPGHRIYEQVRSIEAAASSQGRALTASELSRIEKLQAESARLYEAALGR